MAGQVELLAEVGGGLELVLLVHRQQAFVKRPMAEMAEGQPVMNVIILADMPGDNMGRGHGRVPVRRQYTNTTKGTAMFVSGDDGQAKALVAHQLGYVYFPDDFLLLAGLFQEGFAVLEGGDVDGRLF